MKIDRVLFALDANPVFQPFWPLNAELYARVYKIRPTLCFVGTEAEFQACNPSTEFGDVVRLEKDLPNLPEAKHVPDPNRPALTTLAVLHGPTMFPNDVCLTSGLDQFQLSPSFFNRAEASRADLVSGFAGCPEYIQREQEIGIRNVPTSHLVAKGSTFAKIMDTIPDWAEDAARMWRSDCKVMWDAFNRWGIDESFFSMKMWEKVNAGQITVDLFSTEFWNEWKARRLNRPHAVDAVDMGKLYRGEYTELHSERHPFPDWVRTLVKSYIEAKAA
jgi:hypothetical protein